MHEPQPITGDGSAYRGKRLLVGITHQAHDGRLIRKEQFHGPIVEADQTGVVIVRADTGERFRLPPSLEEARPGEYRLRSTGEVVVDPDFLATWTITEPAPPADDAGAGCAAGAAGAGVDVRPERAGDADVIRAVHDAAFGGTGEGRLVDALRDAGKLVVSLVAEWEGQIVGHVGFSPVTSAAPAHGLGLGPLGVRPDVQRGGIGGRLVKEGLAAAARYGADFVVVLGDPRYYGRFGFGPAGARGLADEFRGGDAFQVIELRQDAIPPGVGLVRYAPEFSLVA